MRLFLWVSGTMVLLFLLTSWSVNRPADNSTRAPSMSANNSDTSLVRECLQKTKRGVVACRDENITYSCQQNPLNVVPLGRIQYCLRADADRVVLQKQFRVYFKRTSNTFTMEEMHAALARGMACLDDLYLKYGIELNLDIVD